MPKELDIVDFAKRVERLCDFLIDKATKDGAADISVIQQLKEDAADLSVFSTQTDLVIKGLADYMEGVSTP